MVGEHWLCKSHTDYVAHRVYTSWRIRCNEQGRQLDEMDKLLTQVYYSCGAFDNGFLISLISGRIYVLKSVRAIRCLGGPFGLSWMRGNNGCTYSWKLTIESSMALQGMSVASNASCLQTSAFLLNPAPGNHEGTC